MADVLIADPMADSAETCPPLIYFYPSYKTTWQNATILSKVKYIYEIYVCIYISNVLYKLIKLIKSTREYRKSQIYRGEICSGVIINPLREQAAVYVAFYVYKIVRITEKWVGGGGGAVTAALVQCAQVRERRGSLVKRRNNLPV